MAQDINKLKRGILHDLLKEMGKGNDAAFEKAAAAASEQAREGKGLIGGAAASMRARSNVAKEYTIATKGTLGKRQAFFEGLLGKDMGNLFKNLGLEKMESPEKIKELREKFELDKKEKKERGGAASNLSKPISLILRSTLQTQKMVRNIEKMLSKPSLKSGYTFDPRMSGGGRYKDTRTNRIVSAEQALEKQAAQGERTKNLTSAIGADEEPLVKLREFLEEKFKDFDSKKIMKTTEDALSSLNGITPTLGLLSVHDKLNLLLEQGAMDMLDGGNGRGRKGKGRKGGRRRGGGGRRGGGFGLGGLLGAAAGGFLAYQAVESFRDPNLVAQDPEALKQAAAGATTPEQKKAIADQASAQKKDLALQAGATVAGGAGAVAGALAVKKIGQSAVVKSLKSKAWDLFVGFVKKRAPKLFAKIGARLALAGGLATVPVLGWVSAAVTVVGSLWMAYDLYQLWKEFSALSEAEKMTYDEGVQKEKSTGEVTSKPTAANEPGAVTAASPAALPGAGMVAAATTTAAAIPAAAGGAAAPTPQKAPEPTLVQKAVSAAQSVGAGIVSGAKQVGAAVASLFSGPAPSIDKVITKQNAGVDTSGFSSGFEDRFSRMAAAFQSVTGKKLMLTSGYRSEDKQLQLWNAKYAEMKKANPQASEAELMKMTRKWVALPAALGGKGSAHGRGTAADVNSKGAAGIDAIDGMTFNGQKVSTDSFLAQFGLKRPLSNEPWHIQPMEGAPTPDSSGSGQALVADSKGNAINLETGKSETLASVATDSGKLPPVTEGKSDTGGSVDAQQTPALASASSSGGDLSTQDSGSPNLTPVTNSAGSQVAQASSQLETSKMVAQATPPTPVVINNSSGSGSQMPPQAPKQALPKASSRPSESSFGRALAKDFSHPTAFTSVGVV